MGIKRWVERYGWSWLWASVAVVLCACVVFLRRGGLVGAITSVTIVDPLVFYTVAFIRNRKHERKWHHGVRRLMFAHAAPGLLNALLIRPGLILLFAAHFGTLVGALAGKFGGDFIWFCMSVPMYRYSRAVMQEKAIEEGDA